MLLRSIPLHELTAKRAIPTVTLPRGVLNPIKPDLTERERQVVGLVKQAKSNKEIAFRLGITEGTVKEYLYHIFRKLGVGSRTQLALAPLSDPEPWAADYYGGA